MRVGGPQRQRPAVVLQCFEKLLSIETERGVVQQLQHRRVIGLEGIGFSGKRVRQFQRGATHIQRRAIAQGSALGQRQGSAR